MQIRMSFRLALVALSFATSSLAWSQSGASPVPGPRELLGLGQKRNASQPARASLSVQPAAKVYKFASADFPGAATSLVFDENTSTVLGDSSFSSSFGFTLKGGNYSALAIPGSTGNQATGINTAGAIVGIYSDFSSVLHGFLKNGATVTTLDLAGGTIEPIGINDAGEIVGGFIDAANVTHGFSSPDGHTFTTFDVPGSTSTTAAGVNTAGVISGLWTDAANVGHGFIYSGGAFTTLDFPSATSTVAIGINDNNDVAGYYEDAANVLHGFVYSNGTFKTVDVAGATSTQLTRIKNNGKITGVYSDSNNESHGLTGH
jgi:hypothetical protein